MNQSRWKSPVLWGTMLAQILAILLTVGAIGEGVENLLTQVGAGVLQLLVIIGVLNNPTDGENF